MGVHGLWKLIDKAGRPIPVETLENKILAIDVSIWLYQLVRGFDSAARPGSNAFLLGLFHRICKLLFYRIKPVFVFDGGVPSLKKKTIAARQKGRRKAQESVEKVRQQLLENLIKQQALGDVLGENVKIPRQFSSKQDELFWLPPASEETKIEKTEEESSDSDYEPRARRYHGDLNSVDITSEEFLKLPADVRHDILSDLKETRKLNSWARIHLMPEEADDFSSFQMGRLLRRRAVQVSLDKTAGELGTRGFTINDLQNILTEEGIDLSERIAGDSSTRFIYASKLENKNEDIAQSNRSDEEDDPSELIHPRLLGYASSSSSESERSESDEILPIVKMMAKKENGDFSQKEILELIKQQKLKTSPSTDDVLDQWRASTSKQSDFTATKEEKSDSSSEMAAQDRTNDPTTRGKSPDRNNEKSKVEPENFPVDSDCGGPTIPQKDTPLCPNQAQEVSPHKNVVCGRNEGLEEEENVPSSSEETERSMDEISELSKGEDDFVEISAKSSPSEPKKAAPGKGIEIVLNPDEPIEDDIFADIFAQMPQSDGLKTTIENAIEKSVLSAISQVEGEGLNRNKSSSVLKEKQAAAGSDSIDPKPLAIVINPNEPLKEDEDIFADVFSHVNSKSERKSLPSPKSPIKVVDEKLSPTTARTALEKPLEIVINPNEAPEDDFFAEVFSQTGETQKPTIPEAVTSAIRPFSDQNETQADESDDSTTKRTNSPHKSLEIVVDPNEALDPDDDLFADVFDEEPSGSQDEPKKTSPLKGKSMKPNFWRLVNDIKKASSSKEISDMKFDLEQESQKLTNETKREERLSSTITEQITQDAQNLLELFGIPYIIAPMEAEAQCAYLDLTGQTEGTITDDSDIWLFGARNVYKNFFDQRKFVKQFKSSDILQCYRLRREDLIMIAMLVGSDYTTGLPGVGPVNAIEIVAHFPRTDDGSTPQTRLSKFIQAYHSSDISPHLLKKLKSLEFIEGFPSDEVVKAYTSPIVDDSREKFTWAKPDLAQIRIFMRDKFGWDQRKTDQTLLPIFEKLSQSTTQKTIHNYFEWAFDVEEASSVSKRVGNAVEILTSGVVPSPSKKPRKDEPKDRLVSNYSRRKYGRHRAEVELQNEPVLEGSRAARAAAKAILAATRKPKARTEEILTSTSSTATTRELSVPESPSKAVTQRIRRRRNIDDVEPSSRANKKPPAATEPPASSSQAHVPALSDILCGVSDSTPEVPSLWTPSRDLVSSYAKRKYGKVGQSLGPKKEPSGSSYAQSSSSDRVMPSKTPAQIARERAAKKLKESKLRSQQNAKTKKP